MQTYIAVLRQIWNDDAAFVVSSELILIGAILVIGMLVGLTTMRDQVVQELGDMASAIGALNQSYTFAAASINGFSVAGSGYTDLTDFCEEADSPDAEPACISVQVNPGGEG